MHYGEEDCPVSVSSSFPKEDELHFEIEMIDFFKAKARNVNVKTSFFFHVDHVKILDFSKIFSNMRFTW